MKHFAGLIFCSCVKICIYKKNHNIRAGHFIIVDVSVGCFLYLIFGRSLKKVPPIPQGDP